MQPVREAQKSNEHQLAYELATEIEIDFQIFVSGKIVPREAGGIGYFSGYLTRKVRNLVTCGSCNQFLVSSHTTNYCHTKMPLVRVEEAENLPESFRRMIDLQDCGGLLYPSNECIHMVMIAAEIFRKLTTDEKRRPKFLGAYSSEEVFVKVYTEVMCNEFSASY